MERLIYFASDAISLFKDLYRKLYPFFAGSILLPFCVFSFLPGWDSSKWIFVYILVSLSLVIISFHAHFVFPQLTKLQKYLLTIIALVLFLNYFFHHINFFDKDSIERVLFWALFFYYLTCLFNVNVLQRRYLFGPLFLGTGLFIICAFVYTLFVKSSLSFTFHNANKAAEFVGCSLALQLGLLSSCKGNYYKVLSLLVSWSLAYLYFTKCRSTYLGVAFVLMYLLLTKNFSFRSLFSILLGAGAFIGLFEFLFRVFGVWQMELWGSEKGESAVERWYLLLNTLKLIHDFPQGVGLGRYEYAAAPYMSSLPNGAFNENYYLFSPHNEFLRFLAEDGVVIFLFAFLFFLSFVYPFKKLRRISQQCPESISFFIFFGFQLLFQFPLIQPFPLFFAPFVLAYTIRYTCNLTSCTHPFFKWSYMFLGLYFAYAAIMMSVSWHISYYHIDHINLNAILYDFWKDKELARNIIFISYAEKDYKKAKKYALKELEREPQDLYALKYLNLVSLHDENSEEVCSQQKFFNFTCQNQSSGK